MDKYFSYLCIHSFILFLNSAFKEKQYSLFAFFSGNQHKISALLAAKEKKQGVNTCRKRDEAVSGRVGSSSLQVGSCLTPATNLPKAAPLDSDKCSALRFSHFKKATGQTMPRKHQVRETSGNFEFFYE